MAEEKRPKDNDAVMIFTDRLVGFSEETPKIVDPNYPIDYSSNETPPNYKCGDCGATGCKLWREYQTFLHHQTLCCAPCAAAFGSVDISDIDEKGHHTYGGKEQRKTDQIMSYVPAIPTPENDSYWGYLFPPEEARQWWHRLPTLPS